MAENRSKVMDARSQDVPVVLKESRVKTERVVSMGRQHNMPDWGHDPDAKIQKARAAAGEGIGGSPKSSGEFPIHYTS